MSGAKRAPRISPASIGRRLRGGKTRGKQAPWSMGAWYVYIGRLPAEGGIDGIRLRTTESGETSQKR